MSKKVLFIVKRRELVDDYGNIKPVFADNDVIHGLYGETNSSGLYNSVRFVVHFLQKQGIDAKVVQVVDNNCIDREVTKHKPDVVVIEALWVVPEKFEILHKLHPNVKWVLRLHSEIPFIAMEGISMDWLFKYSYRSCQNVFISANSSRVVREIGSLLKTKVFYTPNLYPLDQYTNFSHKDVDKEVLDISCFGAVRPLKNHLIQAIAAIEFADSRRKKLRFHINGTRVEGKADPVLKNIRELFMHTKHELVQHHWMKHEEFVKVVKTMDIGMQVSFTETYNIVAADHVDNNIPMVTSNEVKFVLPFFHADPTSSSDIVRKLDRAWITSKFGMHHLNKALLQYMNEEALDAWLRFLNKV